MFAAIERTAKFIQNIIIILGIFGGLFSLLYGQYDKRVDRTVSFTKEYNASVRKSLLSLFNAWNSYAGEQDFYSKTQDQQKDLVNSFFKSDQGRELYLDDALDFYDTLYVCVDRRSCDRNSALDFFGQSITSLYEAFAFRIFSLRESERDPSVGRGLERMYQMKPESWRRAYFL